MSMPQFDDPLHRYNNGAIVARGKIDWDSQSEQWAYFCAGITQQQDDRIVSGVTLVSERFEPPTSGSEIPSSDWYARINPEDGVWTDDPVECWGVAFVLGDDGFKPHLWPLDENGRPGDGQWVQVRYVDEPPPVE